MSPLLSLTFLTSPTSTPLPLPFPEAASQVNLFFISSRYFYGRRIASYLNSGDRDKTAKPCQGKERKTREKKQEFF